MLIYTKGRELLEKDLREQEKAEAEQNQGQTFEKREPKKRSKKYRRFFRKMDN